KRARDAVGAGIENRPGGVGGVRHARIDGGDAALLVASEEANPGRRAGSEQRRDSGVDFVGVRPLERWRDRRVWSAEAHQQRALFAGLEPAVAVAVEPLVLAAAERLGVGEIEIAARHRRGGAEPRALNGDTVAVR